MKRTFFLISLLSFVVFTKCQSKYSVRLTNQVDPDIVLINIEQGDRAFIGNLLMKIDSCQPLLIGVDAWFIKEKTETEDSVLVNAFKQIQNDFVTYFFDSSWQVSKSHEKFTRFVSGEGLAMGNIDNGLQSSFTPVMKVGDKIYEQFALKIIKHWKPEYNRNFSPGKPVTINFTRTLEQFFHFDGSLIDDVEKSMLKNKIVLLGYLGPESEDKHFTPIRMVKKFTDNEPDTYGLVIIANEIRTLLDLDN